MALHLRAETTAPIGLPAYTQTPGIPLPSQPQPEPNANDPNRGSAVHNSTNGSSSVSNGGWVGIAIALSIIALIAALLAFFIYRHLRARRLGIPPPGLNPFSDRNRIGGNGSTGVVGWVKDKFYTLRRGRNAGGAYESSGGGAYGGFGGTAQRASGRRSGFRGLDPDEAWDEQVGNEAEADYGYEEQGVGLSDQTPRGLTDEDTGYERARYGPLSRQAPGGGDAAAVGRSELDERYDEETGRKGRGDSKNPFEDPGQASLRSISPRPGSLESVQGSRKSAFREESMT